MQVLTFFFFVYQENKLNDAIAVETLLLFWDCSMTTPHLGGVWVYTFFVLLRGGKLGGGWYFIQVRGVTVKKKLIRYFRIIKEMK